MAPVRPNTRGVNFQSTVDRMFIMAKLTDLNYLSHHSLDKSLMISCM